MNGKVECMSCGASNPISKPPGNIKEVREESRYEPIILIDTSMRWLCPPCVDKAIPHIQALTDLFKNDSVYWNGLPHMLKRKSPA